MEVIVILLIISVIFLFIGESLKKIGEKDAQKITESFNNRVEELESLREELLQYEKEECRQYLTSPDYRVENYPVLRTERPIPLYFGDMDSYGEPSPEYGQQYLIWKNENNLCFITSFEWIKKEARRLNVNAATHHDVEEGKSVLRECMQRECMKTHAFFIPLPNIEYFALSGQTYASTEISGGGGTIGGTSIPGAIIGGMVAGGTGAVIGSRKAGTIDPIKSHTVVHDERDCYIKFKTEEGTLDEVVCKGHAWKLSDNQIINVAEEFYDILKKIIPEKEYTYVLTNMNAKANSVETTDIEERLLKAKNLLDKGLITQEEYESKREDILKDM